MKGWFSMEYKYTCSEYVVAFVDVLGASEKIKNDEEASLNLVHNSYDVAINYIENMFDKEWFAGRRPYVRIFSDNILIYCPVVNDDVKAAFVDVVLLCAMIQIQFLSKGELTRGGIAVGNFFSDEVMVWGQALIDAHTIESCISVFPRIVIHPTLEKRLQLSGFHSILKEDNDALYYVDYLALNFMLNNNDLYAVLNEAIQDVKKMIEQSSNNLKILQKLTWHKKYLTDKMGELIGLKDIQKIIEGKQIIEKGGF